MAERGRGGGRLAAVQATGAPVRFSALVVGVRLLQQSDVGEGEVAPFALALALPLAVHVDLGHLHHVAHLRSDNMEAGKCTADSTELRSVHGHAVCRTQAPRFGFCKKSDATG